LAILQIIGNFSLSENCHESKNSDGYRVNHIYRKYSGGFGVVYKISDLSPYSTCTMRTLYNFPIRLDSPSYILDLSYKEKNETGASDFLGMAYKLDYNFGLNVSWGCSVLPLASAKFS
jgi:hypothetical protein